MEEHPISTVEPKDSWYLFDPTCFFLGEKFEMEKRKRTVLVEGKETTETYLVKTGRKRKLYYGLTILLQVYETTNTLSKDELLVRFKVSYAFCSPKEESFDYTKGREQAKKRFDEERVHFFDLSVRDVARGNLLDRAVREMWKYIFRVDHPQGASKSVLQTILQNAYAHDDCQIYPRAGKLGVPDTLVWWMAYGRAGWSGVKEKT